MKEEMPLHKRKVAYKHIHICERLSAIAVAAMSVCVWHRYVIVAACPYVNNVIDNIKANDDNQ